MDLTHWWCKFCDVLVPIWQARCQLCWEHRDHSKEN